MAKQRLSPAPVPLGSEPADLIAEVRGMVGGGVRLDEELLAAAMRGWSDNTRRAFRSDLTLWGAGCRRRRILPGSATASDIAAWIRAAGRHRTV